MRELMDWRGVRAHVLLGAAWLGAALACSKSSADAGPAAVVVPLWSQGAPGFEARKNEAEQAKDWWVKNIHNPSLTVYLPEASKATGAAVVIAPGGGFRELVFDAEGRQPAEFLRGLGVAAFVLKYRLPNEANSPYTRAHSRADLLRALRLVRSRSKQWRVDPTRVGSLGFSAGGELISLVAYADGAGDPKAEDPVDRQNGRPDFQVLIYPGGAAPSSIGPEAPPAFILVANDDEYGCDRTALDLLVKLRAAHVKVEAHFLAQGKHAFNMGSRSSLISVRTWPQRLADWLRDSGYLSGKAP